MKAITDTIYTTPLAILVTQAAYQQETQLSLSRRPESQEETFKEQEAREDEEISPPDNISSSSLDEVFMPPPPS